MKYRSLVLGILIGLYSNAVLSAQPMDAQVVQGQVQFANPSANVLQITNSPNSIINWQQFNIDQHELVRFVQQNADSSVLNRVVSTAPSSILGSLESNGRVFVINPNGIVFGQNATVNTAGMVASTLNLSDDDFLKGHYQFEGNPQSGAIENNGFLMAGAGGEIVLLAPQIRNNGVIRVDEGQLILAAGEKITLSSLELDGISFEVQAPGNEVINLGQLIAQRGSIGVFAHSIRHDGAMSANSIGRDAAGNIVLRAQANIEVGANASIRADGVAGGDITIQSLNGDTVIRGMISAMGEGDFLDQLDPDNIRYYRFLDYIDANRERDKSGGNVHILGERVALLDDALISTSGLSGGGEILLGGDYRGENPGIQNASGTFVGLNTRMHADAITQGNGGRVIVWGNDSAQVHGAISATGGALYGDGGFVETSGHYLEVTATPDVSAHQGTGGIWLLDPFNITIVSSTGTLDGLSPNFTANAVSSTIAAGLIQTALQNGPLVVIDTNSGGIGQAGDVLFNGAIVKGSGGTSTLRVRADGDIILASGISSSAGLLNIDFVSDRNLDGTGGIDIRTSINTNGGNASLVANGTLATSQGILMAGSGEITTGTGAINVTATAGPIEVSGFTFPRIRGDGLITVSANAFNFPTSGQIGSSLANLTILPGTNNGTISLGSGTADLVLPNLTGFQADTLTLGSLTGGDISIDNATITIINTAITNRVVLQTGNDINFNQLNGQDGLNYSNGTIVLQAGGQVVRNNPAALFDVNTQSLDVTAVNGINLATHITSLAFNNTGEGVVRIIENNVNPLALSAGNNSSTTSETVITENDSLTISGGLTLNTNSNNTNISAGNNITISNTGSITNTGSGSLSLVSNLNASATIANNGSISSNGRMVIGAGSGGTFNQGSTGLITNNGVAGADIQILADDFVLQAGSSINSGALSKVILEPVTAGTDFALGNALSSAGLIGLTQVELNTIGGNLVIGDAAKTNAVRVDDPINLAAGLSLHLEAVNTIDINAVLDVAADLRLVAGGGISQTARLSANLLDVRSNTAVTLNSGANQVGSFTANVTAANGTLAFADVDGFNVNGITFTGGNVNLSSNGQINQLGAASNRIIATTLSASVASDANVGIALDNAANAISGAISLSVLDAGGSVPSLGDIHFANTVASQLALLETGSSATINSAGAVSQSGRIRADSLAVNAFGGIVLNNAANDVNAFVAINNTAGQVSFRNGGGDLNIVPLGVQNLSSNAADNVAIVNTLGSITVDGLVTAVGGGVTMTANGAGIADIIINTDVIAARNLSLAATRDIVVNGTSIGGPGVFVEALGSNMDVSVGRNLRVSGGALLNESARIQAAGTLNLTIGNNLSLLGGAGENTEAVLEAANILTQGAIGANLNLIAGTGLNAEATLHASNNMTLDITGDARLAGGSGVGASAVMSNINAGDNLTVALNIGGDLIVQGGTAADAAAAIGTDDSDITIGINANNVTLTAGTGGGIDPGSLAAIGALGLGNDANVTVQARGNVTLSSNSNAKALIGSDQAGGATVITAGFGGGAGNIANGGAIRTTGNLGLTATALLGVGGNIAIQNGAVIEAGNLTTTADGQLLMANGSFLSVANNSVFNNDFAMNGGLHQIAGAADFRANYAQQGGRTELLGGSLAVAGNFDLLAGVLSGSGTITTPLLNNVGGKIAPGTDLGPLPVAEPVIGTLLINGDLQMGSNAILSLDLRGSDSRGGVAGIDYDLLRGSGNVNLGGELQLVVNVRDYFPSVKDRFAPLRFQSTTGDFARITAMPNIFKFEARTGENGLAIVTTEVAQGGGRVPNELEALLNDFESVVDLVHQSRRARRMRERHAEEDEKDDEEGPRKSLICSI